MPGDHRGRQHAAQAAAAGSIVAITARARAATQPETWL
jgi:hypothetical protein